MENFEDKSLEENGANEQDSVIEQASQEPEAPREAAAQNVQGTYRSMGTGRKESPFADSPFVEANPQPRKEPEYQFTPGYTVPPVKEKKNNGSGKGWKIAVSLVLAAVVVGGSIAGTAAVVNSNWEKKNQAMLSEFDDKLEALQSKLEGQIGSMDTSGGNSVSGTPTSSTGLTPGQVYNQNVKSVVAISNHSTTTNYFGQVSQTASSGSGFILTEDGYVVTNYHVVEGATTLSVILYDGEEYEAKLIGYEDSNDVALLKIDAAGLPAVKIGSSNDLIVGDMVVAIGNPLGELTSTQTVGYISAKDRDVSTSGSVSINMLQTDAAINSGNSGGPLFNMKGEVIGITTAKYSGTSSSGASIEGIGFAIPIDDVIGMISDLKEYGYVTGAYLGVSVRSLDEQTASTYSLPMGSLVDSVVEGLAAERAGVQPKDIIVALGEYPVENNTDLTRALRKFNAGDSTTITVYRSGKQLTLDIVLDEKPQSNQQNQSSGEEPTMPDENSTKEEWEQYFHDKYGEFFDRFNENGG